MLSFKQEEEEEEEDRIFQWFFTILQSAIMSSFKPMNRCLVPHRSSLGTICSVPSSTESLFLKVLMYFSQSISTSGEDNFSRFGNKEVLNLNFLLSGNRTQDKKQSDQCDCFSLRKLSHFSHIW